MPEKNSLAALGLMGAGAGTGWGTGCIDPE
jgi:hypothetical protein